MNTVGNYQHALVVLLPARHQHEWHLTVMEWKKNPAERKELWWKINARMPKQRVESLGEEARTLGPCYAFQAAVWSLFMPGTSVGDDAVQVLCHHVVLQLISWTAPPTNTSTPSPLRAYDCLCRKSHTQSWAETSNGNKTCEVVPCRAFMDTLNSITNADGAYSIWSQCKPYFCF